MYYYYVLYEISLLNKRMNLNKPQQQAKAKASGRENKEKGIVYEVSIFLSTWTAAAWILTAFCLLSIECNRIIGILLYLPSFYPLQTTSKKKKEEEERRTTTKKKRIIMNQTKCSNITANNNKKILYTYIKKIARITIEKKMVCLRHRCSMTDVGNNISPFVAATHFHIVNVKDIYTE